MTREFAVPDSGAGDLPRVDAWLASVSGLSRSRIKALIEGGCLSRGGVAVGSVSQRVRPGEAYVLDIPETAPSGLEPQDIPLDVIFEDGEMLVVNKPPDLVVHPAAGHPDGTLVNAVLHHCPQVLDIGGEERPGIVHRLDRDTSGVMVIAKTDAAMDGIGRAFREGLVHKTYLTIVHGIPMPLAGHIENSIGRHRVNRQKMAVVDRGGKNAITDYEVAERFARSALVRVSISTGRTHQIRVHMLHLGFPVAGDQVYGRRNSDQHLPVVPARQMLHSWKLALPHPVTGEAMAFEAEPPADFRKLLEALRAEVK